MGATLGLSGEADVYRAAFTVPDFTNYLLAGGALSIVFIPLFTAHLRAGDEARGWRAFSLIANTIGALLLVVIPALLWAMPLLAPIVAPGFDEAQRAQLVHLSRIMLPAQACHLLGGLFNAALMAKDRHAVPALGGLLYNVGIIAGGLAGGDAEGFAWGVTGGAFVGSLLVPLIGALRAGLAWAPILSWSDPDLRIWAARTVPVMLGWSIVAVDDWVVTHFASAVATGKVALMGYAKQILHVPMGVFGFAMGQAAFPTVARLADEGKTGEVYRTLSRSVRLVLVLALGAQVALTVAGPEIATVIYSSRRIDPTDLNALGSVLAMYAVALGAWSVHGLFARGFYARGLVWMPTWIGTGVLVVSLPLYAFLGERHGALGLAAASSIGVTTYAVILESVLRRQIGDGPGHVGFLVRLVPALVLGIAAGWGVRGLLPVGDFTTLSALGRGTVLAGTGGIVYFGAAGALGVGEVREVMDMLRRGITRR